MLEYQERKKNFVMWEARERGDLVLSLAWLSVVQCDVQNRLVTLSENHTLGWDKKSWKDLLKFLMKDAV